MSQRYLLFALAQKQFATSLWPLGLFCHRRLFAAEIESFCVVTFCFPVLCDKSAIAKVLGGKLSVGNSCSGHSVAANGSIPEIILGDLYLYIK